MPLGGFATRPAGLPRPAAGSKRISVRTGQQERVPLRFDLPATLAAGDYELAATVRFGNGEVQKDSFAVNVLPYILRRQDPCSSDGRRHGPSG